MLVPRGYHTYADLDCVLPPEMNHWNSKPNVKPMLRRVLEAAHHKSHEDKCNDSWMRERLWDRPDAKCSALKLVEEVKACDCEKAWEQLAQDMREEGVECFLGNMKPTDAIKSRTSYA